MELYKLKANKLVKFNGGFVVYDNRIYTNPTEEIIRKAGYKDLVDGPIPEYDENTQYLDVTYVDGDVITRIYEVVELEIPEEV